MGPQELNLLRITAVNLKICRKNKHLNKQMASDWQREQNFHFQNLKKQMIQFHEDTGQMKYIGSGVTVTLLPSGDIIIK